MAHKQQKPGKQGKPGKKGKVKAIPQNPPVEELSEEQLDEVNGGISDIQVVKTTDKSSPTIFH